MKTERKMAPVLIVSILLLIVAGLNIKWDFIAIPGAEEMISRQIDYITISTVFAGFAFTALGLILGLSSEQLIEKIKNTSIIMDKVSRMIWSIAFFILSVVVSLIFVLAPNSFTSCSENIITIINDILYVLGVGYMIVGIGYFVYSVYELYDLLKRIYGYNQNATNKKISVAKEQMENTRRKMREIEDKQ